MKQKFYKATILLPLSMVFYVLMDPLAFCVPEINLYFDYMYSCFCVVMITVLWLCCSPLRKSCSNGTWTELLFNLIPVEIVSMIVFSERYFWIFMLMLAFLIICEIIIFKEVKRDEHRHKFTNKRHRMYKALFHKLSVLAVTVVCAVPCFLSLFVYGLRPPTYRAEQQFLTQLFAEIGDSLSTDSIVNNPYQENVSLWKYFEDGQWKKLSVQKKITVMQCLVEFECNRLGIPSVPVAADMIGEFILGTYDFESNEIWINTEHLAESTAGECIQTICHETYHACQNYLVNTLDWNNPALHTLYFQELRSWQSNQEDYKTVETYGIDAYEKQPLEVAAREYATEETGIIMDYIKGE